MTNRIHYIFLTIALLIAVFSCNESEEINVYNADLLFPYAAGIDVEPYVYVDLADSLSYFVNADTTPDTLGSMPEFRWKITSENLVTVAISKSPLIVSNSQILNADEIFWQWHTGLKENIIEIKGNKYMQIPFTEGRPVNKKNILYETQPLALENGLYFWAIWGWDKSGKKIQFSSIQLQFIVK